MTAIERLRRLAENLPEGGSVSLPKTFLEALVAEQAGIAVGDFTVPQLAERFQRSASTIRSWLEQGSLRGYRLRGRQWRVTSTALAEFEERERSGQSERNCTHRSREDIADLSAWRTASWLQP